MVTVSLCGEVKQKEGCICRPAGCGDKSCEEMNFKCLVVNKLYKIFFKLYLYRFLNIYNVK